MSSVARRTAPPPKRSAAASAARSTSVPAAVAGTEDELALHLVRGTSPSTRTPTSRIRARCSPRASYSAAAVAWISPVPSVASGRVRERVIVVKSAKRTFSVTVRPATPAVPHPPGDLGGEPQQLAQDHGRVVGVAAEGLVGPHALVGILGGPARGEGAPVGAPGEMVQLGAGRDADAALEGGQRGVRDVADRAQPEPVQLVAGLLPHAVELTHVEGVQEAGHLRAEGRRAPRRAWRAGWPAWRPRPSRPPRPSR